LLQHHPPFAVRSAWLDEIRLQDAPEFERVLWDYPQVRLVCCGHVHQEFAVALGRGTALATPAVGPAFRPGAGALEIDSSPPGYRLVELQAEGRWSAQSLHAKI
jgi:Icc protein